MTKSRIILLHALRCFIGAIFIFSAVAKLLSIDAFELYIFEQRIVSFNFSTIAARLIISIELILGLLLIANLQFKKIRIAAMFVLGIFSAFLMFQLIKGDTGNCNCFGELLPMTPGESLIKNITLLFLFLFLKQIPSFRIPMVGSITLFIFVFSFALPPVLSPPDFLVDWSAQPGANLKVATKYINSDSALAPLHIAEGKKMICMFSITCHYCMSAATKIDVIVKKYGLENNIVILFAGDSTQLNNFLEQSSSTLHPYTFLPLRNFFAIAGPSVPAIFLSENGILVQEYNYRSIDEKEIEYFFK